MEFWSILRAQLALVSVTHVSTLALKDFAVSTEQIYCIVIMSEVAMMTEMRPAVCRSLN